MLLDQRRTIPRGLKPRFYAPLAARLKPCPFKNIIYATSPRRASRHSVSRANRLGDHICDVPASLPEPRLASADAVGRHYSHRQNACGQRHALCTSPPHNRHNLLSSAILSSTTAAKPSTCSRRITGGAKSIANLLRRELGQQSSDPSGIGARNVLADPPHVHAADELLGSRQT